MKDNIENINEQSKRTCEKCGSTLKQTGTKANHNDGSTTFFFRCPSCQHRVRKHVQSPGMTLLIYDWGKILYSMCDRIIERVAIKLYQGKLDNLIEEVRFKHDDQNDVFGFDDNGQPVKDILPPEEDIGIHIPEENNVAFDDFIDDCIREALNSEMYDFIRLVLYQSIERFELIQAKVSDIPDFPSDPNPWWYVEVLSLRNMLLGRAISKVDWAISLKKNNDSVSHKSKKRKIGRK